MYGADKAIATAVENCSKEEQAFVYDIICQNFLVGNSSSMTEEERQANISLGMKKAEYAAENFISEDSRKSFLDAMESVAKLASSGKADSSGNMDYGVAKGRYLGHGSSLVSTLSLMSVIKAVNRSLSQQICHWRNYRIRQIWNMGEFMTGSWRNVFRLLFQGRITGQARVGQIWRMLQVF